MGIEFESCELNAMFMSSIEMGFYGIFVPFVVIGFLNFFFFLGDFWYI